MKLTCNQWLQPNNQKIDDKLRNEILKYYKQNRNIPGFLNNMINGILYTFKKINVLVEYNGTGNLTVQNVSRIKNENIYPLRISIKRIKELFQKDYVNAIYLDEQSGSDSHESNNTENKPASININVNADNHFNDEAVNNSSSPDKIDKPIQGDKKDTDTAQYTGKTSINNNPEDSSLKLYEFIIPCKTAVKEPIMTQAVKDKYNNNLNIIPKKDKPLVSVYFCIKGRKKRRSKIRT